MKQLVFLIGLTLVGTIGVFLYSPFLGVFVYYFFAVLRPQYLWGWALADYSEIGWSLPVALATILAAVAHALGLVSWKGERDELARGQLVSPAQRPGPLGLSTSHLVILMYGGWVCLSYMFADFYHEISALYLVVLLKMLLMFAVSAYLLRSVQQLWLLLIMAAFCLAYIGYEVNFQYLKVRKISILHSGYSGLDNNGAAMMLAMGVPLCLFVWEGTRRWWRWLFAAAIPSLIHAVLLTYSRGAMVTLVLTAPLFYLRSQHKKQMTLAFVAVGLMLPIMAGNEIRERFFSIQKYEEDDSAQSRFRSWQAGWEMALDHPLFGVGFRNSPVYMYRYGSEQDRTIHNLYIQIAADSGIVGMGIYVFALWSVWVGLVRARRVIRQHPGADTQHLKALVNGVECSMGVFCVGSLFLSLEVFELSYFLLLIGAQFPLLLEGHFQREPFIEAPAHELSYPEPTAVR